MSSTDPETYVRENKETLQKIIRHGDDKFVRSLCLAALIRYGDEPDLEDLQTELERAQEEMDG